VDRGEDGGGRPNAKKRTPRDTCLKPQSQKKLVSRPVLVIKTERNFLLSNDSYLTQTTNKYLGDASSKDSNGATFGAETRRSPVKTNRQTHKNLLPTYLTRIGPNVIP
jgi:hypothetical protein